MKLNSLHLKLLAASFMLIDHLACFLTAPEHEFYIPLRMIGRLAAPLFWFCFAQSLNHTSDRKKFIVRLGIAALIMGSGNLLIRCFVSASFDANATSPNMFLTLFLMATGIYFIETAKGKRSVFLAVAFVAAGLGCFTCVALFAEYGWVALASILSLYCMKQKRWKLGLFVILNLLICHWEHNVLQMLMVFAVPFMAVYSPEKPKHSLKRFFYIFYPGHIWLMMLLSNLI